MSIARTPALNQGLEDYFPVEKLGEIFAAGVGAEAAAATTEVAAVLGNLVVGDDRRLSLVAGGTHRNINNVRDCRFPVLIPAALPPPASFVRMTKSRVEFCACAANDGTGCRSRGKSVCPPESSGGDVHAAELRAEKILPPLG